MPSRSVVVIGAGPAGLSAAYELCRHGRSCLILEASGTVGGLSRTERYKGFRFDIGGHRFFTRVAVVKKMWIDILGEEFLLRPRLSRIHYKGHLFRYPLEPLDTLRNLGLLEALLCAASYVKVKLSRSRDRQENLEQWLVERFGWRLYRTFFKTYTEKVWGIPCSQIAPEWAAQRIRGLSVKALVREILGKLVSDRKSELKTLIEEFSYPRLGPGQMWESTARYVEERGCKVLLGNPVTKVNWEPGRVLSMETPAGVKEASHYISSMPIRELFQCLSPAAPEAVAKAAGSLRYRDFITVAAVIDATHLFADNWIYVHDSRVKVGRIQNYKNWSSSMVPDPSVTCLGMEYFCFEGDELWQLSDSALTARAASELATLGLLGRARVIDATVIRVPKAYPVYDGAYQAHLSTIRSFLEQELPNLQLIGRNGMHRYNNQDHSMLTGMLAARNIMGFGRQDLWSVNADEEYHEDGFHIGAKEVAAFETSQPRVPELLADVLAEAASYD